MRSALLTLFLLWGSSSKSLVMHCFKSDRDEIWQDCSSTKYTLIHEVEFFVWCHNLKMAAMTSFNAVKCCYLVNTHAPSAQRLCSSVCQFLIYRTSVFHCCSLSVKPSTYWDPLHFVQTAFQTLNSSSDIWRPVCTAGQLYSSKLRNRNDLIYY